MEYIKKTISLLSSSDRAKIVIFFVLLFFSTIFELLSVGIIYPFIKILLNPDSLINFGSIGESFLQVSKNYSFDILYLGLFCLLTIFITKNLFLVFHSWWKLKFTNIITYNLANKLFKFYLNKSVLYHIDSNSSVIIRNILNEVNNLQKIFYSFLELFFELVVLLSLIIMLFIFEPIATFLSFIILFIFSLLIYLITKKKITNWGNIRLKISAKYLKNLTEALRNIKEIKLFNKSDYFIFKHNSQKKILTDILVKFGFLNSIPKFFFEIVAITSLCLIIFILVRQGRNSIEILPILAVFGATAYRVMPSFSRILNSIQAIKYRLPTINVLYSIYEKDDFYIEKFKKIQKNKILNFSFKNKIIIKNLNFSYRGKSHKVLKNVSIEIKKGETVGIIGKSGSGKSTLINIIMGLLQCENNQIFIDGKDLNSVKKTWQSNIGYVPQSIYLLDTTIKKNIAFAIENKKINFDKIINAIKKSKIENFINKLDNGIDTKVGELGSKISGGQIQRIGIARAIYNNPKLIILDEATSSLDKQTEDEIIKEIRAYQKDKTVIMVSHKLNTLKYCDKIYEIINGKVYKKKFNRTDL